LIRKIDASHRVEPVEHPEETADDDDDDEKMDDGSDED